MTPPRPGLLEAALYAADLDAARSFYRDRLGLEIETEVAGRHVFFRLAGAMLLVFDPTATTAPPSSAALPVPPHGAVGPGHVCFAVAKGGIDAWRDRLRSEGVEIEADFTWPNGARSLYFRDPAGNSVEIAERGLWGFS